MLTLNNEDYQKKKVCVFFINLIVFIEQLNQHMTM